MEVLQKSQTYTTISNYYKPKKSGTYRVYMTLRNDCTLSSILYTYTRVYVDGVAVGQEFVVGADSSSPQIGTVHDDISVSYGQLISVRTKTQDSSAVTSTVYDIKICCNEEGVSNF